MINLIISERGRKSGGVRATGATASLAPLEILLSNSILPTYIINIQVILCKCRSFLSFKNFCHKKMRSAQQ